MDAYGPAYSNGLALEEGQDYSETFGEDELFESYELTKNSTQQNVTDNATKNNQTKVSSKETNHATKNNKTDHSSASKQDNAKEKNNTKDSNYPKEESHDYQLQDKEPGVKKAESLDSEVILK